jgi:cobalt-zinc-cadmium resistance protein CzcA
MSRVLRRPLRIVLLAVALFAVSVGILMRLGGEFIPELEEGDFAVDTRLLTGSSLSTTVATVQQAAGLLKARYPEVEKVVTKTGSGEIPTDPMPIEASDMMVILKDKKYWTSAHSFDELAEKMSRTLQEIPGISAGFQFPVQMRFNELMTGGRQDVVCKIFGDNLDTLAQYAQMLGEEVRQVPGAVDIYVESVTGLPQFVVRYRRDALLSYGISVEEVNKAVQTAFAGATAGRVFEDDRRFDLVVRLDNTARKDLEDLRQLPVILHDGSPLPLYQLADVNVEVGPNQIQREDARRRITVGFNVRGRDVQSIVEELKQRVNDRLKLPAGYIVTYGGQFENLIAAKARLAVAVPLALGLILLLLYFAFGSLQQSILVFSAIPLSAIGGVLALWGRGMPFSISAGIGFIALFGVAVLNGIVLVTEFNLLKKSGVADIRERIVKGTRIRLRPVLMTAAVASLGFLPMALSQGAGAEVQRPLATVVIGGLISATLLTLLVLPVLYLIAEEQTSSGKRIAVLPLILLLMLESGTLTAQSVTNAAPISLSAAVDSALRNNRGLLAKQKGAEAADQLTGNAFELPLTEVGYETGKLNSPYDDRRFSIQQRFASPVYYANKRRYLGYSAAEVRQDANLSTLQLRSEVRRVYTEYRIAAERLELLRRTDSLFARATALEELRRSAGESDPLQSLSIRSRREELRGELQRQESELRIMGARFQTLLGTPATYLPSDEQGWESGLGIADTLLSKAGASIWLKAAEARERSAWARWKMERATLGPEFTLGAVSQSFAGFQRLPSGEIFLDRNDRYQSFQLSVGIPLFFFGGKARVKSARASWEQSGFTMEDQRIRYRQELAERLERLKAASGLYAAYRDTTLVLVADMEQKAGARLKSGDIRYFEWLNITEQCLRTRTAALDAYRAYLLAVIDWNELNEN